MAASPDEVLNQLTHLPPETNPFQWLADFVKTRSVPHYSHSASTQMYFNIAMLDLCLVFALASLALRYRKNHFWLFRKQINRTLIQPNLNTVCGILGLVVMSLSSVLMFAIVEASNGGLPSYLGYLTFLEALLPCMIGEVIVWSIAASYLGHLHSTQSTDQPLGNWIVASNVLGIATPIVHLVAFLPLDVIAGKRYSNVVDSLRQIDELLSSQAKQWTPSSGFDVNDLITLVPLFTNLESNVRLLGPISRAIYILHAIATVLITVGTAVVATPYLASVRKLIRKAKQDLLETNQGSELIDQIHQTWAGLVMVVSVTGVVTCTYFALTLYSAIHPLGGSQDYVLAAFWINSSLALILSGIMLYISIILVPIKKLPQGSGGTSGDSGKARLARDGSTTTRKETNDLGVPPIDLGVGQVESVDKIESEERSQDEKEICAAVLYRVPFTD